MLGQWTTCWLIVDSACTGGLQLPIGPPNRLPIQHQGTGSTGSLQSVELGLEFKTDGFDVSWAPLASTGRNESHFNCRHACQMTPKLAAHVKHLHMSGMCANDLASSAAAGACSVVEI